MEDVVALFTAIEKLVDVDRELARKAMDVLQEKRVFSALQDLAEKQGMKQEMRAARYSALIRIIS